ncbi:MAG: DUF6468 domain-containing protein [Pacificimonas sp.]
MTADPFLDRWIDLSLGALLFSVLIYGMILSRRLANFKSARRDLEALIATLSGTVVQAKAAITALTEAGDDAEERLTARLRQARRLTDEMESMNASSEALAVRLETAATQPKSAPDSAPDFKPSPVEDVAERPYAPSATAAPKPGSLAAALAAIEARQKKAA